MKKLISMCLCLILALVLTAGMGLSAWAADDFQEVTAVDNGECAVTVKSIDPDDMWGYTLKVLLENRSAEKTYMFSVESAYINGVKSNPYFATEVAPGKKANKDMQFKIDDLEDCGLGEVTDIKLTFHVFDSDDIMAEPAAYETMHIYPQGEDKAELFVREDQGTDVVLADNEDITFLITGCETNDLGDFVANVFFVNKTDRDLMFSAADASVNGYMINPYFANELAAGMCSFGEMSWSASKLEENDIEVVEDIEFTLHVFDADDFSADDVFNETVTLTP